jgi:large subunit ribosomal protein L24
MAFSTSYKSSKDPSKQRSYRLFSPAHISRSFLSAPLSKELRSKYNRRSIPLVVGDKVEIMRGSNAKKQGEVERTDLNSSKVYITGLERSKLSGANVLIAFDPSNLLIKDLNLKDAKRKTKLQVKATNNKEEK